MGRYRLVCTHLNISPAVRQEHLSIFLDVGKGIQDMCDALRWYLAHQVLAIVDGPVGEAGGECQPRSTAHEPSSGQLLGYVHPPSAAGRRSHGRLKRR